MSTLKNPLLRCENISKQFKGVQALKNVDFEIYEGVVHGLVGENGAGKSTLTKIISGAYSCDQGQLFLQGNPIQINGPEDAIEKKIVTIYQDSDLIPTLSVAENIYLNQEPTGAPFGFIKKREVFTRTSKLLKDFGIDVDPLSLIRELPNDLQKMIQIIKAVSRDAKILLMDEPTSSLTKMEVDIILKLVRTLAEKGVGIVFISHYLSEVFQVCDLITVLRDGEVVNTVEKQHTDLDDTVGKMIGRRLGEEEIEKESFATTTPVFSVNNLNVKGKLKNISFSLNEGDVLGITGLIGSGCTELAKAMFKSEDIKSDSGEFFLYGEKIQLKNTEDAVNHRIALITNDRKNEGLFARFSLCDNICLPSLKKFTSKFHVLDHSRMLAESHKYLETLHIKTPDMLTPAESLSGGNQQKVLLAKWLETDPKIFIMDEPTVGIDVGTKYEIRKIIKNISKKGVSVILITAELEELEALCDRVLVMFRGEIVKEFVGHGINKEEILKASTSGG